MKVDFNNPEFPDGVEFDVGGVLLVNGEEVEFDEEQLELYKAKHGRALVEDLAKVQFVKVNKSTLSKADKEAVKEQEANDDEVGES